MPAPPHNPIDDKLVQSDGGDLPDNLIAIAVKVDEYGIGTHSGLVIGVDGKYKLFHYTGEHVRLEPIPAGRWYFHKELEIISADEALVFLSHCELILENASPLYGFVFDGSYYNARGEYIGINHLGEYTTCVGFCINAITGYLFGVENYFQYEDWNVDNVADAYFNRFMGDNPHLNAEEVRPHWRRIPPAEYTASAYLTELPIRRARVNEIIEAVTAAIAAKRN